MLLFGLIIAMAHLGTLAAQIAEVQHVQLGATVTMGCNLSYGYDTAWLKNNPNGPPTLVVYASLSKGDTIYRYQPDLRFSVEFINRSLTLTISDVEKTDLGMYYCMTYSNTKLLVGSGTILQGPFQTTFYHWYCAAVSCGLLSMVTCVCLTHWKTKVATKTSLSEAQKDKSSDNIYAISFQEVRQATSCDLDSSDYL